MTDTIIAEQPALSPKKQVKPIIQLSPHFTSAQACYSDHAQQHGIDNHIPQKTLPHCKLLAEEILEPLWQHYRDNLLITSWYRAPRLNRAIGGAKNSYHRLGLAVDLKLKQGDTADFGEYCAYNLYYDKLILEYYLPDKPNSGWVHIQIRADSYDDFAAHDKGGHREGSDAHVAPPLKIARGVKGGIASDSEAYVAPTLKINRMQVYEKNFNQPYERVL